MSRTGKRKPRETASEEAEALARWTAHYHEHMSTDAHGRTVRAFGELDSARDAALLVECEAGEYSLTAGRASRAVALAARASGHGGDR